MEKKYQKGIYKTLVIAIKLSFSGSGVEWAADCGLPLGWPAF